MSKNMQVSKKTRESRNLKVQPTEGLPLECTRYTYFGGDVKSMLTYKFGNQETKL